MQRTIFTFRFNKGRQTKCKGLYLLYILIFMLIRLQVVVVVVAAAAAVSDVPVHYVHVTSVNVSVTIRTAGMNIDEWLPSCRWSNGQKRDASQLQQAHVDIYM